jgi:hypothetical protein
MTRRFLSMPRLLLIALTVGLLFLGANAFAQSKAIVNIPFAFKVHHQTMPRGHYTVELLSDRYLCFSDPQTGRYLSVIMIQPEPANYIETRSSLLFRVHGLRHYLLEVRFAGSSMHRKPVVTPSFARELAQDAQPDSTIEIAMK